MEAAKGRTQTWDSVEGLDPAAAPRPTLIRFFRADDPLDLAEEFDLEGHAEWKIGRTDGWRATSPAGVISSLNDTLMSHQHATITREAGGWRIADTASKNGTFVNDVRLSAKCALTHGDVIQCGFSFFIFTTPIRARLNDVAADAKPLTVLPLDYQIEELLPFSTSDMSIHLQGETGSGKEVVAQALHELSGRPGAFVARNCAAIPDNLFESELFGHARGAFTGAASAQPGQILAAHRGTLFLDEIGELTLTMQAKLLRVLELKEVLPLGAQTPIPVDFRLVSATLCDLEVMVAEGRFRRDLYARLGRTFRVPPLREHKEQLGRIIRALLVARSRPDAPLPPVRFKIEAARALVRHSWPLNIREMKQCIESGLTAATAEGLRDGALVIEPRHLPGSVLAGGAVSVPSREPRRGRPTDDEVIATLRATDGDRSAAARRLRMSERTLYRRLERLRELGVKA